MPERKDAKENPRDTAARSQEKGPWAMTLVAKQGQDTYVMRKKRSERTQCKTFARTFGCSFVSYLLYSADCCMELTAHQYGSDSTFLRDGGSACMKA